MVMDSRQYKYLLSSIIEEINTLEALQDFVIDDSVKISKLRVILAELIVMNNR